MENQEKNFEVVSFQKVKKKNAFTIKPKKELMENEDQVKKAIEKLTKKGVLKIEVTNKEEGTKTLYNRLLGAKYFEKKQVKI